MSLRTRTLSAIGLALAVGIVLIYVLIQVTLGRDVARLNDSLTEEGLERALVALHDHEEVLRSFSIDYAAWDDTYEFLKSHYKAYEISNMPVDSFYNNNLDLLLIYDTADVLVYSRWIDTDGTVELPVPESIRTLFAPGDPLLAGETLDDLSTGFMLVDGQVMVLGICPVLTSANTGPSRGTWVWGRMLRASELASISKTSGAAFELIPGQAVGDLDTGWEASSILPDGSLCIKMHSHDSIYMCAQLQGLTGEPVALARVRMPARMSNVSARFTWLLAGILLAVAIVLAVVVLLRLAHDVLNPLAALSREISSIQSGQALAQRVKISGRGELVALGNSVNTMLAQLEQAYSRLEHSNAELAASEKHYRQLFDLAQEGIAMVDAQERITFANPAFCANLGYALNEIAGTSLMRYIEPQQHELVLAHTQKRAQGQTSTYEIRLFAKGGEVKEFLSTVGPRFDDQGAYQGAIGFFTDISEHKRRQQRLADTQRLESLGILAGGIAHDFNNILVSILGNAQLALLEADNPAEVRPLLNSVVTASQRASDLTRQMLAYSGRGQFIVEPVNVNTVITDITSLIKAAVPKNALVTLQLEPQLRAVLGDAAQLHQVILNLVLNGAEALGGMSGTVSVTTAMLEAGTDELQSPYFPAELPPGTYVACTVEDTGCGLDAAALGRLFEPFYTTKETGRGLGLSAVLGIVRSHGGTIRVTSRPGAGTSFSVLLPALECAAPEVQAVPVDVPLAQDSPAGYVLVVDDEANVREVVTRMLERKGIAVLLAEDGEQAAQMLSHEPARVSLVLLDLTMPRQDGISTLVKLRQISPSVPVVLMSGYAESEISQRCAGLDVTGFLSKPFSPSQLHEAVARHLGQALLTAPVVADG